MATSRGIGQHQTLMPLCGIVQKGVEKILRKSKKQHSHVAGARSIATSDLLVGGVFSVFSTFGPYRPVNFAGYSSEDGGAFF